MTPTTPYPWGEHSRPGKLTEADLDAHNAEFHPTPLRRGVNGVCSRRICVCERDGLGDQCIWLEPVSGPAPLGYESAPCPGICQQGRCQRPEECLDFADSSAYGQFAGTVAERNAEQTKLPALVTGVAILATIAAVLWAVLS